MKCTLILLGDVHVSAQFTEAECELYQRRYEEGYDIPDTRYEQWLAMNKQPSSTVIQKPKVPKRVLHEFLPTPKPPVGKKGSQAPPGNSRVLTSVDYVQFLQEKERKKRELAEEKEKRK